MGQTRQRWPSLSWRRLPEAPLTPRGLATHDVPSSVGQVASTLRLSVYDSADDAYVILPPPAGREDVYDDSSTALGRDLVVYGGQRWAEDGASGDGELVGDAWLRSAPTG